MSSRESIEPQKGRGSAAPSSHGLDLEPPKRHRWGVWIVILLLLGGAAWYFHGVAQTQAEKSSGSRKGAVVPAAPVVVATAWKGDLPVYFTGLGTVTAFYTVTIHTHLDGEIMQVYFKEGQFVNKGDALVEIDPRPYQVMLEQAQGQLAKDQATLKDAELDFNRYTVLANEGVIPRQQLDTQTATMDSLKGAIKTDQAAIDTAKLDLVYCHITAPITGRIGLRLVDPGNIVHATDTTGLLVITQLQPIAVIFTLTQDQLPEVYKELRAHDRLPVDAYDRDDTTKIASGYLQTMDNQIDTTTGTYKLKAVFNNEKNELFPNQFVNIHLLVSTQKDVTIIPAAAVQRGPDGTYVYVVNSGNTVKVRNVKVGFSEGNNISIASGLQPGEEVVTDGLDKLTDGSKIETRDAIGDAGNANSESSNSGQKPPTQNANPAASQATGGKGTAGTTSKSGKQSAGGARP
jgi:membrane fusion protein, multidrug efflux system